eukprot:4944604-Amphidinium_carterae.1
MNDVSGLGIPLAALLGAMLKDDLYLRGRLSPPADVHYTIAAGERFLMAINVMRTRREAEMALKVMPGFRRQSLQHQLTQWLWRA